MTPDASTYFGHLRAYVNDSYVLYDGTGGEVVLTEKYFAATGTRAKTRRIRLILPGHGLAFKLDHDQVELQRKKFKPPLFQFLDDNAKPWSKRCDFVIFYTARRAFHADCIEFKSKSLTAERIVPQLRAGICWVRTLKQNPGAYLDVNRQLNADPSIRYYHFDEVNGQPLTALHNTSVREI
jgi:hypothetical protein